MWPVLIFLIGSLCWIGIWIWIAAKTDSGYLATMLMTLVAFIPPIFVIATWICCIGFSWAHSRLVERPRIAPKVQRSYFHNMIVVCRRCFRRAQVEMPPIGATLRCTECGRRQRFGERQNEFRTRAKFDRPCQVAGIVRFADRRRQPGVEPAHAHCFDDVLTDLFIRSG
jgi:hypothetical protein